MKSFSSLTQNLDELKRKLPNLDELPDDDGDARCPLCDGYGHVIDARGARPCICVTREVISTGISESRIPNRFAEETLDTFDPRATSLKACLAKARQYANDYSLNHTKGLYIHGPTGVGKTHIACGILKTLIMRRFDGVFYNVVDLLDAIRSTYDPQSSPTPKGRLINDQNKQIFVLDDFGKQKTSSWVSDRLYALINRRYQDCKTIIVTSQIGFEELTRRVDSALASRIIDMCEEIEIKADDYRRRRAEEPHGGRWERPSAPRAR
ncbi:MAG: hypothetical protein C4527_20040 [Candidatus Omnitrophota bacterium]|jgi:DNA replication protein DnaC|nr:MAG: hypothetical protein C4527_20040 [Candidatus Omnitrophota bacterium]